MEKTAERADAGQGLSGARPFRSEPTDCARSNPPGLPARQIEAARVAITRYIKRGGKLWIRIFPDKPVTIKPAETRMGKGKGNPEFWVAVIKPGRMMFELEGVPRDVAKEAMRLASYKLPLKTKFVASLKGETA